MSFQNHNRLGTRYEQDMGPFTKNTRKKNEATYFKFKIIPNLIMNMEFIQYLGWQCPKSLFH